MWAFSVCFDTPTFINVLIKSKKPQEALEHKEPPEFTFAKLHKLVFLQKFYRYRLYKRSERLALERIKHATKHYLFKTRFKFVSESLNKLNEVGYERITLASVEKVKH